MPMSDVLSLRVSRPDAERLSIHVIMSASLNLRRLPNLTCGMNP